MLLLANLLKRFVKVGTLKVIDAGGRLHVFQGEPGPVCTFRILDRSLERRLFFNPDLALGEGYMDGTLLFEDCSVYDFLHLFNLNRLSLGAYPLQSVLRT